MSPADPPDPAGSAASNVQEYSVSELSRALKRTVEDAYSYVRVRGEISGYKRAASGHLYMTLKDSDAVLDAVCWRGTAGRLSVRPEDGLEVIATGRLTTYAGRSKYQVVVESLELAGEGALLKLLEDRRRKLAEEGLFDETRKRPLPYLPAVIGVVTSPTGAVIRDILHRLQDRFPRHVLVWPVAVQGDRAAEQVAAAIAGFNALDTAGGPGPPRPDLLIVARGGGSLEDLWAFNEEVVVRAAAASAIPLISAVGHETDTTLIDHAADRRAPTPTAAAEIAVPVRADLLAEVMERERRLVAAGHRDLDRRARDLAGLERGLAHPRRLLETADQRLDDLGERLEGALPRGLAQHRRALDGLAGRLRTPTDLIRAKAERLDERAAALDRAAHGVVRQRRDRLADSAVGERMARAARQRIETAGRRLDRHADMLESLSYHRVLERGYAVVRDAAGGVVTDAEALSDGDAVALEFRRGGRRGAVVADGPEPPADAQRTPPGRSAAKAKAKAAKSAAKKTPRGAERQRDLF